jgi:hypothetical protein
MMQDLPTTIFVPSSVDGENDYLDDFDEDDDLSLSREYIKAANCGSSSRNGHCSTPPLPLGHALVPRQVSPEPVPREIFVAASQQPALSTAPLEHKYREGLKKLAKSMKHSDLTRSVIKRQSKYSYRGSSSSTSFLSFLKKDFFLSARCEEFEDCRRQILGMIQEA